MSLYAYGSYSRTSAGGWYLSVLPQLTYRPSKALSLSLGVEYDAGWGAAQYVARIRDTTATATLGTRYVFAGLRQSSLDASLRVNATFSHSLEVEVDVTSEDPRSGARQRCCDAFLTFAVLGADGKPTRVPPLLCENDEERRRAEEAAARRQVRLAQRGRGKR